MVTQWESLPKRQGFFAWLNFTGEAYQFQGIMILTCNLFYNKDIEHKFRGVKAGGDIETVIAVVADIGNSNCVDGIRAGGPGPEQVHKRS